MAGLLYLMAFEAAPQVGPATMTDFVGHHVTILGSFALPDKSMDVFIRTIRAMMPWFGPITVEVTGHTIFGGKEKPVEVALVKEVVDSDLFPDPASTRTFDQLHELHESILAVCHELGGVEADASFTGVGYVPHVTGWNAPVGSRCLLPVMTLVEHRGGFGIDVHNLANFTLGVV